MEVLKTPGAVMKYPASGDDLELINALAKTELSESEVYTFALRLCDNEIDRDFERFDTAALHTLGGLFIGKCGIFDHNWTAANQTARLYRTEVLPEDGVTAAGEPRMFLKGCAYMLRNEKNADLIDEIEAGIKKEVSVGCSMARRVCSICGRDCCEHLPGKTYGGRLCYFTLSDPVDAYEWSFVAVPAQRNAGIIKSFGSSLRDLTAAQPALSAKLDQLEKEARLGRTYLGSLRKELVRLAGLGDGELDLNVFSRAVDRLDEPELLELTKAFRRQAEKIFPPQPQIRPVKSETLDDDGAFLV